MACARFENLGLYVFLVLCPFLLGWSGGHVAIRSRAVQYLPRWQRELLNPVVERLCREYASLQDQQAAGNRPDLDPYCIVPDAELSLHDINDVADSAIGMQWYLSQICKHIRAQQLDEAAKFLGVFCHWIEDPGAPGFHCIEGIVNEYGLRELLPPPEDKRKHHYLYGYMGLVAQDEYNLPQKPYTPQLLGSTIAQAALHLFQQQRQLAHRARASVIPVLQSELYGDGAAADAERTLLAQDNAQLIADLMYTALCLATDRVDPAEVTALHQVDLTTFLPNYSGGSTDMPYKWVPFLVGQSFDQERKLLLLQLPGPEGVEAFESGIGMGTPFALTYAFAPGGVYSRFSAKVGLHPAAGETGSVRFVVRINDQVAATVGPIGAGEPARLLTALLPAAGTVRLRLITEPGPDSRPEDNLAVWAQPTLRR